MRHRKKSTRLGRKNAHRKATLKSLARAFLVKESIRTTKIKAKQAQSFIDNLITVAKNNTPESKRQVFALIRDKSLINVLFNEIAPRFKARSSGYTRIIPIYPRRGDGSPMAILELVEKKIKVSPKKIPPKAGLPRAEKKKEQKKEEKPETKEQLPSKAGPPQAEKADVKEEIHKEKAKEEKRKIEKKGFFKNLRRYFRGKAP